MAIDSIVPIKGASPTYPETNKGAHYYAFSPTRTKYQEAFANIVLPDRFKNIPDTGTHTNYTRNGYISLGIKGLYGVDLGLKKDTNYNWHPYSFDVKRKEDGFSDSFKPYTTYAAPDNATNALITVNPVDTTHVRMYVQFLNSSGAHVGVAFNKTITVASGNLTSVGGNISCQYYRFASLVQPETILDNQKDSTYMLGGKFINLGLYNRNTSNYKAWGINTSLIEQAWKVSPERMSLRYTNNSDTFGIDHWFG